MASLSTRTQVATGFLLAALLAVTRSYHFATLQHWLPSASYAAFFLAGVYLRPRWAAVLLFGVAGGLDYASVTWGGVSDYCVSPAYVALIPAYGALWLAGRWYAAHRRASVSTLARLAASVLAGTLAAELIASGGFYFYSGRFADPTLAGFALRLTEYFPASLESTAFWTVAAALVHLFAAPTEATRARSAA